MVAKAKKILPVLLLILALIAAGVYMVRARRPRELVLSGSLEARTVNVGSLVGGRVSRVLIDEGAPVTTGQLLVTIETETIDRQISEQKAAITSAQAELTKALAGSRPEEISKAAAIAQNDDRDRKRMATLYHDGIVSKDLYQDAETKAKASAEDLRIVKEGTRGEEIAAQRAKVEQQQRRLDSLMKQRAETDVHSSVTGVVQSLGLRPGDLVAPNQTVAEILEADQLWVRVYVPETLLGLVRVGQQVRVQVDTFPNEMFPARIATISSQGEYTPRNVQTRAQRAEQVFGVKVVLEGNSKLKAGMAADVDLGVKGRTK
ncbi:MAG TPA: efflux RND transporter periplasmic adaptor subunit [Thermoanaerobaculia bacterium]|nr:efflux RND transporter periplasmic adaptor subunit [Thermoanaerobaculia bacterium]